MFELVISILEKLFALIKEAEALGRGEEKKSFVIARFCEFISSIPQENLVKVPAFLQNPENISYLIDLAVALGNFIRERKSYYLMALAKALLSGDKEE